jgi:GTPase SAR1 family protein
MTLYDTAVGMEYHERTLTKGYYRDSCVALLVYSADSIESVTKLLSCIKEVIGYAPEAKKFIIRNKIDLEDQSASEEEVSAQLEGAGYRLSEDFKIFKTSALWKDNQNGIEDLLLEIGRTILEKTSKRPSKVNQFDSFYARRQEPRPEPGPGPEPRPSCC